MNADTANIARSVGEPRSMVAPDAMSAAAAHVEREYGGYGYRLGVCAATWRGDAVFEVSHSDGSRFRLYADRYGNVERVPDAPQVVA